MAEWSINIHFLEKGDIYFFYKPKKEIVKATSITDVARFFFVLAPSEGKYRYIVLGNKKMPSTRDGGNPSWGLIQMVGGRGFAAWSPGKINTSNSSRPAGEGIYTIITHRDHTHLLYSLELPRVRGAVQKEFNIAAEGNYIFLERPVKTSPNSIEQPFSNFSPVTKNNLDIRGTEILLVGVGSDVGRLGISVTKDKETMHTADIFNDLKLSPQRHPINSLITGEWV